MSAIDDFADIARRLRGDDWWAPVKVEEPVAAAPDETDNPFGTVPWAEFWAADKVRRSR